MAKDNISYSHYPGECDTSSPCENGATCFDEIDGFTCQCTDQWLGTNCTGIYKINIK